MTIYQIWEEYRQEQPDGYSYSQFCYHFQVWRDGDEVTMHIEHKVGDKLFVDFAGKKLTVSEPHRGGRREVESFVAVLGASQLGYLQVVETQQKEDLIAASAGALDYIGGVPAAIVPDCLKSAVTKADPYEPDLNRAYAAFARHYGMVVLPARSRKPKDKALVEQTVRLMYQRVYAKLRDRTFYSIDELNAAIGPLVDKHNATRFQRLPYSRRELFDRIERAALQPLPAERFELMQTLDLKVQFNYHIELREDRHYYSVPWRLKGTRVQVLYNERMVEIYHDHLRVAAHRRARTAGGYTTVADHMPAQHRFYADWSPERILRWAGAIGPEVAALVGKVLDEREHPEQGFKVALGIINLHRKYGVRSAWSGLVVGRWSSATTRIRQLRTSWPTVWTRSNPSSCRPTSRRCRYTPIFAAMTTTTARRNTDEQPSDTGKADPDAAVGDAARLPRGTGGRYRRQVHRR